MNQATDQGLKSGPEALASATAPDLQIPQGTCLIDGIVEPCTLVIIGASGDLTARKIIPALYNLDLQGGLPDSFLIVGCARTPLRDEAFREKMKTAVRNSGPLDESRWLADKVTRITIQFKEVPHSMFRQVLGEHISANRLVLGIYPDEKITLTFQTKNPGAKVCLRTVTMDFQYHQNYSGPVLEAYEKVLLDVMLGDHLLFGGRMGSIAAGLF